MCKNIKNLNLLHKIYQLHRTIFNNYPMKEIKITNFILYLHLELNSYIWNLLVNIIR